MNFKKIHIGKVIENAVIESGIQIIRICKFFRCSEGEVEAMYKSKSLDSEKILRWSKLLGYDFFRLYTQHLVLYAPPSAKEKKDNQDTQKTNLPQFRKSIYTKEIIDFIMEQINEGKMTKKQVMEKYKIPKTTLYKWISKYKSSSNT